MRACRSGFIEVLDRPLLKGIIGARHEPLSALLGKIMAITRISREGKYLAQCQQCGVWVELHPETVRADLFFEILEADFSCCGLRQSARFILEKDAIYYH